MQPPPPPSALLAEVLGIEANKLPLDTLLDDIADWDSLAHISLIARVDEDLGVGISIDEMNRCETVGALVALLEEKTRAR